MPAECEGTPDIGYRFGIFYIQGENMKANGLFFGIVECLCLGLLAGCAATAEPPVNTEFPIPPPLQQPTPTPYLPAEPTPESTAAIPPSILSIAAGWGFTLALTDTGAVKCWGSGYLCDGSTVNKSEPVDKPELTGGVAAISSGGMHACALMQGGAVKCWGQNNFGQLGNDTRTNSSAPVDVVGLSTRVIAVAAGGSHTCALMESGGVKCWGENGSGQLGDGTYNLSRTPVDVVGLSAGVVVISAGGSHTCAVTANGGVKCWGWNGSGELGNPNTIEQADRYHPFPADVEGLTEAVVDVTAGESNTCVRTERGAVKCWGQRGNGQLGDGVPPEGEKQFSSIPVDVLGLSEGTAAIAVGLGTSCAVNGTGAVFCWGVRNGIHDPEAQGVDFSPVPIEELTGGVIAVTIGESHVCILTVAGTVNCWGANAVGQLGDGTTNDSAVPVEIIGLP
jgi:alpha-tubulin suppressor-like RCC1 family protein